MDTIGSETTIGELVRAVPARSRLFENLGIDYCCGGKKPLAEVCQAKGLDPETVIAMLSALDATPAAIAFDPNAILLGELCDHIERVHHNYLREELPRLDFMTRKVSAVHGGDEPRLREIRRVFESFQTEISSHTTEEEAVVFPKIREMETGNENQARIAAGLQAALAKLESEHETAGNALERFKELTDRHTPPEWACNTFRALYDSLSELDANMRQHVHLENNVLFLRALVLCGTL